MLLLFHLLPHGLLLEGEKVDARVVISLWQQLLLVDVLFTLAWVSVFHQLLKPLDFLFFSKSFYRLFSCLAGDQLDLLEPFLTAMAIHIRAV